MYHQFMLPCFTDVWLMCRYSIRPGRHWDGVARSNGFEKRYVFEFSNRKAVHEREQYLSMLDQ